MMGHGHVGSGTSSGFGMPRHDNTPDDRVPLVQAVLTPITQPGADAYTTMTNQATLRPDRR